MFAAHRSKVSPLAPAWSEGVIRAPLDGNAWRLDDGRSARQAVSCLVTPQPGDAVLLLASASGECFVVHVLSRDQGGRATLAVPGADGMSIRQDHVDIASQTIAVRARGAVEVTSVEGAVSLNARRIVLGAAESLVQTARTYIGQMEQYLLTARQLLRLHGEQTMITARQDAKIDAERISLG
ncbi:hypothetical protein FHW69_002706 [Luteibacter sp. Sphag1AF]|uniref:DUF3540 domain-containing protein n=1 Tax=Luteibacter sp. Sphag1AF TaxID=2587031 RepID=UPI001618F486|nr:DUF3540 domain-containing protein [Luteibacter sp. Sphag1AF]MBB3228071.1 hypothetical protein [Luteibacter sp. Sphag1AF]